MGLLGVEGEAGIGKSRLLREWLREKYAGSEADLRGALDNDSLTDDEVQQIQADRMRAEDAAALREEDYQLAYAIDILKGLSALGPKND